jgi:hypothetical protein
MSSIRHSQKNLAQTDESCATVSSWLSTSFSIRDYTLSPRIASDRSEGFNPTANCCNGSPPVSATRNGNTICVRIVFPFR